MSPLLIDCAVIAEGPNSFPRSHIRQLTTAWNSSSENPFFWPLHTPELRWTHSYTDTQNLGAHSHTNTHSELRCTHHIQTHTLNLGTCTHAETHAEVKCTYPHIDTHTHIKNKHFKILKNICKRKQNISVGLKVNTNQITTCVQVLKTLQLWIDIQNSVLWIII